VTTRQEWAQGFIAFAGWAESQEKTKALVAQASRENTGAANNPLATTEPAPGATIYNSAGVRNYPSLQSGFAATLATFRNGYYPHLLGILSDPSGGSSVAYCSSPELNVWGTGTCMQELAEINAGDPHGYLTHQIAGGGPLPSPPPAPSPIPPGDDMDNLTFIRWVYWTFLFRQVDAEAFANWNNWLAAGGTREQMIALVGDSPEGQKAEAALRKSLGLA
jgi:hypothetical protein